MPSTSLLLAIAISLGGVLVLLQSGRSPHESGTEWGDGKLLPAGAALLTFLLILWVWGGLKEKPIVYDEAAYLLQAELLARGKLTAAAMPVPAAFTQSAVLVTPVLAPKMPLGYALALVPGVWLGVPGLVPVLLGALTAYMMVVLSRQLAGAGIAILTLAVWWTQAGQYRWRASYFTEVWTTLLWLVAWWSLLRWRETRALRWLVILSVAVGLGAITRPLTMLIFCVPIWVLVLRDVVRHRLWRDVLVAGAVGVVLVGMLPLQNHAVLGRWTESPLALYTRQYVPFDKPGFGLDSTPPLFALTPQLAAANEPLRTLHAQHQIVELPRILVSRLHTLSRVLFGGWRVILVPAFLVGLGMLSAPGAFGLMTVALLYLGYLVYAHEPHWGVYYIEGMPVLAFVVALGLGRIIQKMARTRLLSRSSVLLASLALLVACSTELRWSRRFRSGAQEPFRALEARLDSAGVSHGLVFIRVGANPDPHIGLVRNVADRENARAILAHDLGAIQNTQVLRAFPDRVAYLYDADTRLLRRLSEADSSTP